MRTSPYAKGECQRCGYKTDLRDLVKEWTGLMVHESCRDPKPEELKPVRLSRGEGAPKQNASPETADTFAVLPGWGLALPALMADDALLVDPGEYFLVEDGFFLVEPLNG